MNLCFEKKAWSIQILFQNQTRLFNSRVQKGKIAGMRELQFNPAAEQKTFQVSSIHRAPHPQPLSCRRGEKYCYLASHNFSHKDLESQAITNYQLPVTSYFFLFPFPFSLFPF
jgi:hypothetical protein